MCLSDILHRLRSCLSQRTPRRLNRVVAVLRTIYAGLSLGMIVIFVVGCGQSSAPVSTPGAESSDGAVSLPTEIPTLAPSPVNTRVMPLEVITPVPTSSITPTITPIPDEVRALVVEVIDGGTIGVVMDGDPPGRAYTVRYLGIDVPPNAPDTPWGTVAYERNRKMTNLKAVRLVRDQTDFDEEGYLLRYVYVGDELLSIVLTEQGLARANIVEPDTKFQTDIQEAEARAKAGGIGLWGPRPPTPTPPRSQPTAAGQGATTEPEVTLSPTAVITATTTTTPAISTPTPRTTQEASAGSTGEATTSATETKSTETPTAGNSQGDADADDELQGP